MAHTPPPIPRSAGNIGLWAFLASLFMLFGASLLGYIMIRASGPLSPELRTLEFPRILWVSTVLVISVSVTLHFSVSNIRRERQKPFFKWLVISLGLACAFVVVQTPAMLALLRQHRMGMKIFGLVFVLVLLHALHVFGGIIAMFRATLSARRGVFDHEHYVPIRNAAIYWHFLDFIWLLMFGTFLILG